jgi:hypothetical protein
MMTLAEFEKLLDTPTLAVPFTQQERSSLKTMAIEHGTLDAPKTETAFVAIEDSDVIARTMRGQLATGKRKAFVLAGHAIVTLRSKATGTRFTYKIVQSDPAKCRAGQMPVFFVSLLNGADNTGDFAYIGTIFADGFRVTRKSRVAADAPSAVAFSWFMKHLEDSRVEVWHEGRCGRCGRTLTVPESIESGLGPVCAGKAA